LNYRPFIGEADARRWGGKVKRKCIGEEDF